jgi:hypothetical protein
VRHATNQIDRQGRKFIGAVQAYLCGTFLLFLFGPHLKDCIGLPRLCLFVALAHACLFLGYWIAHTQAKAVPASQQTFSPSISMIRKLIIVSALYHIAYGVTMLREYGCTGIGALIRAAFNPGEAYFAKFGIYEEQLARVGNPNAMAQLLTLSSVVSYFLIPCSVVYWRRLDRPVKALVIAAVSVYAMFFVFIGTQKGLGDIVAIAIVAHAVRKSSAYGPVHRVSQTRVRRRRWIAVAAASAFLVYMSQNQLDRLRQWGGEDQIRSVMEDSAFCRLLGSEVGFRASLVTAYPTHGYCGLSHSLSMPFEWTCGLGSSRALNAYLVQYLNVPNKSDSTYLARAEVATGWPALMNWSTIYPWLASDFTFPGVLLCMVAIGWIGCRAWHQALRGDLLSLIVLSQFALCVLYIPANNQLLQSRDGLIGTVSLVVICLLRKFFRGPSTLRATQPLAGPVACMRS